MHKNAFDPIFRCSNANRKQSAIANDESIEQPARRLYGTKEQQALMACTNTSSNIVVKPLRLALLPEINTFKILSLTSRSDAALQFAEPDAVNSGP